jgi:uncharacterized protein (TIGR02452 family)
MVLNLDFLELARETETICEDGEYLDDSCEVHSLQNQLLYPTTKTSKKGFILVESDMLDVAKSFGVRLVLIFASHRRPGGGWKNGKTSQEESFYLRSNLCKVGLTREHFFYKQNGIHPFIVSSVSVFRDSDYRLTSPWLCDFVYLAAPVTTPESNKKETEARIVQQIRELAKVSIKSKAIVIGPWGCGVYGNDPKFVATTFKRIFQPLLDSGEMDRVIVAIQPDENGRVFREVFEE